MAKTSKKTARKETLTQGNYPAKPTVNDQELRNRIAEKAYEIYEKRGRVEDNDVEHWLEAERLVCAALKLPLSRTKARKSRRGLKGSESG